MNFAIGAATATSATQAAPATKQHAQLVKAAREFEAMLMQEMLKPMRGKDPLFAEPDANGSDSDQDGGVLQGFGTQAMAEGISAGGGLGIAKLVVRQVEGEHAAVAKERAAQK